jgi:hypothetical protein
VEGLLNPSTQQQTKKVALFALAVLKWSYAKVLIKNHSTNFSFRSLNKLQICVLE